MPERVQLRRTKGWRIPANTVKVDRTTRWGNPYVGAGPPPFDARWAVDEFRAYAIARAEKQPEWLESLRGKNLACWCHWNAACHADVLLELANSRNPPEADDNNGGSR